MGVQKSNKDKLFSSTTFFFYSKGGKGLKGQIIKKDKKKLPTRCSLLTGVCLSVCLKLGKDFPSPPFQDEPGNSISLYGRLFSLHYGHTDCHFAPIRERKRERKKPCWPLRMISEAPRRVGLKRRRIRAELSATFASDINYFQRSKR